jgi:hypothetical protein
MVIGEEYWDMWRNLKSITLTYVSPTSAQKSPTYLLKPAQKSSSQNSLPQT